jgi:hypothetical protein
MVDAKARRRKSTEQVLTRVDLPIGDAELASWFGIQAVMAAPSIR